MEEWLKVSLILCMFGTMKEFRPSESFIIQFFINPPMNFTMDQVSQEIFPVHIYAYMVELIIVFLVTDFLRYKIIIIMDSISGLIVYIILLAGRSVFAMQVAECVYGFLMAGEIAYYTYIYAKVGKEHYQEVTSYTRTAYLIGRSISGVVSQTVVTLQLLSYYHLQYLNVAGLAVATLWGFFLPSVETSIYFHRRSTEQKSTSEGFNNEIHNGPTGKTEDEDSKVSCASVFYTMWLDMKHAFTNMYVIKLLIWSVVSTGGYFHIILYIQLLWQTIANENDSNKKSNQMLWNGAVETVYTLLGAGATFMTSKLKFQWAKVGDYILSANSLIIAILLFIMSQTNSIWIAYVTYMGAMIIYQATITIINSEIAQNLREDSYGLIFGVITFLALVLQTALTTTLISRTGFALPQRTQYLVYACYFAILAVGFTIKAIISTIHVLCCHPAGSFTVSENT